MSPRAVRATRGRLRVYPTSVPHWATRGASDLRERRIEHLVGHAARLHRDGAEPDTGSAKTIAVRLMCVKGDRRVAAEDA